jgi:hypothetical protein
MNRQDLSILAKYFKHIGKNKTQIRKSLLDFCEKFTPNFNEILSRNKIDSAIKDSEEYGLRFPIDIAVTNTELDIIKNYGDYKRQKILFVMLVIAKYFKYNDTKLVPLDKTKYNNEFYVNDTFINILKIAKVNVSRIERMYILNDLQQSKLIATKKTKRSVSFKINFVCESSDSAIIVNDMNNIIEFYPFYCEKCGKILEKTGRRQKYCKECYKKEDRKTSNDRHKMRRNRIKNLKRHVL